MIVSNTEFIFKMKSISFLFNFFNPRRKMSMTIIFCSIFLTSSVQACWLYRYWFSDSEKTKSVSSTESRSYEEQASSWVQSSPSKCSKSSYSSSPTSSDQTYLSFGESQQSVSINDPQQSILTTDSIEDTSTDDSIYDHDISATSRLKMPSPYEKRESPKPDLNCIMFDDSVCSITCNQVCLLYNFESTGICTKDKTCYCTIIGMKSPAMTLDQYENQSLDDLWYYKFVKSSVSAKILNQIKKYPTMTSKVLNMLRKPLRTGDDVKNRLSTAYPEWIALRDLKSRRRAPINRFIDDQYQLNETGLENRIKRSVKKYRKEIVKNFSSIDYLETLRKFLDSIDDEAQLKYIFKQIHETKIDSLIEYTKNYLQRRDLDFSKEDLESEECDCLDVDYIDNIVAGAIIQQFLGTISASANSSNELTSMDATQNSASSTQVSLDATYDTRINGEKCSCSGSSGTTVFQDDDSRWELPGFDQIMVKDYRGSVDEVWKTSDYYVKYQRWSSGSIRLEWKKGNDSVLIEVYSSGSIDQEWHFGSASIKLSIASSGSITQSWELGDVSYSYSKWSSGSVERKWKDNNNNQSVLAKYQGYISSWCAKNYFLIERWHCEIY